jgi:F420-dependent oxidoreductase-like protein
MRLGLHLVRFDVAGGPPAIAATLASLGEAAESAGLANLSLMDHYLQLPMLGDVEGPMLEGYTTLGFLAAHTRTVELQLLVTGVTYRHPGLLAKIVSTLDVLSGGRAVLGLGAAWFEREHLALGVPFPPLKERFERLEETLQIVRQMWGPETGAYVGHHYRLAATICSPMPLRPVPVMVGGQGERKTLRLVARYADACNLFANPESGAAQVGAKLDVLRAHCDHEGTDFERLRRTVLWNGPVGEDFPRRMAELAALGVEEVHVMHFGGEPVAFVEDLGRTVVPALAEL